MAFTVEDFHDLIELLAQHPEWRAELRRHVLSDDLIELPTLVRQLVEAQARAEARLEGVEARLERVEARLEGVEARLERVETRLDRLDVALAALAEAQTRTAAQLDQLTDRVGGIEGEMLELRYARLAPSYFGPVARRLSVIEPESLANLLDDAVELGQLSEAERDTVLRSDLVLSGRRRSDRQNIYLLAEISVGLGPHDVERAVERASLLEKLGWPVLPIVAGRWINDEAAELAREQGVWYVLGGRVTAPDSV